jgi:hypothetical protein
MDTATVELSYNGVLKVYEASVNTINFWRKRIAIILILGIITISLVVLGRALFFHSTPQYTEGLNLFRQTHTFWEDFEITFIAFIGAVICGLLGRKIHPSEEIEENDELISQQKSLAAFSLALFLVSDVMLIVL